MSNILVFVMTTESYTDRHNSIKNTWGKDIDFLFYSDHSDDITVKVTDDKKDLVAKQINIIKLIQNKIHLFDKYEWFFFCDDDTFINTKTIKYKLNSLDINYSYAHNIGWVGYEQLRDSGISGGAGFFISKKNILRLFDMSYPNYIKAGDVAIDYILRNNKIKILELNGLNPWDIETYKKHQNESWVPKDIFNYNKQITYHYINDEWMNKLYKETKKTIGIITAIFGDHDTLKELPENHGFDEAVCYTDNKNITSNTWKIVYHKDNFNHPRLSAKQMRFNPEKYLSTDRSVWIDGSCKILSNNFKDDINSYLDQNDFYVWDHPESMDIHPVWGKLPDWQKRSCIYKEATHCMQWEKYQNQPLQEQIDHYKLEGMPENFGLWATGTIARNHNKENSEFGKLWLEECIRWSIQDQVSFGYLVWKTGIKISTFPQIQFSNDGWVEFLNHNSNK